MNKRQEAVDFMLEFMPAVQRSPGVVSVREGTRGEMFVLEFVRSRGQALPGEISRAMQVSTARIAAVLGQLEGKGLLVRTPFKEDHRKVTVSLTAAGEETIRAHYEKMRTHVSEIFCLLGEEDSDELIRILKRVKAIIDQQIAEQA